MREGKTLLLAAAVLGASAAPSAGQTLPGPSTPPVTVQGNILYNSNVAASSAAFAAQRGLVRADEIYTPSLNLNYIKQIGLESFTLTGQAGYDFYERNTILDRERLNGTGGFEAEVADCQVTLQGTYARAQSNLEDLSLGTTKNTLEAVSGGLNGTCNPSGNLIPSFSLTQSGSSNSAIQLFTSDYHSLATEGSILHKDATIGDISLFGQYTQTQFPHRLLLSVTGTEEDGYNLYAGGGRVDHQFGSKIDFQMSLSESSLRTDGGVGANFNGLTYDSSLNYQIGPRLLVKLSLDKKTNPSTRLDATYEIVEDYRAEADYELGTKLNFDLGASDTKTDYEGAALISGTDLTRESTKSFFGELRFDITPKLSLNLTATQDQRHADIIGYSYASAQLDLSISQAF